MPMRITASHTSTVYRTINRDHRLAIKESGLAQAGCLIADDDGRTYIRYRVANDGSLRKLASYDTR